jgi:hypothetical protein
VFAKRSLNGKAKCGPASEDHLIRPGVMSGGSLSHPDVDQVPLIREGEDDLESEEAPAPR